MREVLSGAAGDEITVRVMASRQADKPYVQPCFIEGVKKIVGGILAGLVFILIESDIHTAVGVFAQLIELGRS